MLTKQRIVLEHQGSDERGWIAFARLDEDADLYDDHLLMPPTDWHDMGSPETITISIEPGDLLNVDG